MYERPAPAAAASAGASPPAPSPRANSGWDQAHLYPHQAAYYWRRYVMPAAERHGLRLGAPAAAPCGTSDCITKDPFQASGLLFSVGVLL